MTDPAEDDVEIAVLGPLRVGVGGRPVRVSGPKRQALLALLAVESGQVLSMDRLVDGLWGERPPPTARAQVQSLVHAVRGTLATAGAVLETVSPGYRLAAVRTDVGRFAELVEQARATTDAARAVELFRAAERMWRGPALDGIMAPFAPAVAALLTEQRLSAIEERLELELNLGRHRATVAELGALVAEHPLRERLRGLLMLALYRCERQADALEVYRQGRELLAEELGLDPGPEMRRLHQAILAADPRLLPPRSPARATSPAPSAPPVRRRAVRPLPVLATLVALLVAVAVTADHPAPSAGRQTPQWVPGPAWIQDPPIPPGRFGITLSSTSGRMPDFAVDTVRFWDSRTRWANVEPRPGVFNWEILDRLVGGANQAGLPATYTFGGTPDWAAPAAARTSYDDGSRAAPPDDPNRWELFVRAVVERYRGRVHAYELWDYPNHERYFNGDMDVLARMARRAGEIIESLDPAALVVCPSFGDLWFERERELWRRFGRAGGYEFCDVAALKLYQREAGEEPESIVPLAEELHREFHTFGVHLPLWNTGGTYDIAVEPPVSEADAPNFATRFFLVGIYNRFAASYFYHWGGRRVPLVLQVEGAPPTRAARYVDQLRRWLDGARVYSCGNGEAAGLPVDVWQCRFGTGAERFVVYWTRSGTVRMVPDRGVYRIDRLNGSVQPIEEDQQIEITEEPVLVRLRR